MKNAVILRGIYGTCKENAINKIIDILNKKNLSYEYINLDIKENKNMPRHYRNFNDLNYDYILIKLSDGGEASLKPCIWINILKSNNFNIYLFYLISDLKNIKKRIKNNINSKELKNLYYKYNNDINFINFSKKIKLNEIKINIDSCDYLKIIINTLFR